MNILVTAHLFDRHYYLGVYKDYVIWLCCLDGSLHAIIPVIKSPSDGIRRSVAKQSYTQGHDEHWLTESVVKN